MGPNCAAIVPAQSLCSLHEEREQEREQIA